MLRIVGKTTEDQLVICGVFRFYETIGLPLDVIFDCLRENNIMTDWLTFYVEAAKAGMKHDHIISKLGSALSDVYGAVFSERVISIILKVTERKT